jgi:hypothetical protein
MQLGWLKRKRTPDGRLASCKTLDFLRWLRLRLRLRLREGLFYIQMICAPINDRNHMILPRLGPEMVPASSRDNLDNSTLMRKATPELLRYLITAYPRQ